MEFKLSEEDKKFLLKNIDEESQGKKIKVTFTKKILVALGLVGN